MDYINQAIDCLDGKTCSLSIISKLKKIRDTISTMDFKAVNRYKLNQSALSLWNMAVRNGNTLHNLDSNSKLSLLMAREIAFKSLQRGILKPWDEKTLILLLEMAIKIGNSHYDHKDENSVNLYISLASELKDQIELECIDRRKGQDSLDFLFDQLLILRFKNEYILKKNEIGCRVIFEQSNKNLFKDYLSVIEMNRNLITKQILELISSNLSFPYIPISHSNSPSTTTIIASSSSSSSNKNNDDCLLLLMDELSLKNELEACNSFFDQNPHLKKTLRGFNIHIKYLIQIQKISDIDLIAEFSSSIICNFIHQRQFIECVNHVAESKGTMLAVHCLEKEKKNASFLILSILIPDQNIPKSIKIKWLEDLLVSLCCEFTVKERRALQSILYQQGEGDPVFWEYALKIGSTLKTCSMDIYNNSLIINLLIENGLKIKAPRSYIDSLVGQCQEEDAMIWKFRIDQDSLAMLDYINHKEFIDESLLIRMIQVSMNNSDVLQLLAHRALSIINQDGILSHFDLMEIIIATSKDPLVIIDLLDRIKIESDFNNDGINDRIYKFSWNLAIDSIERENYKDACNILKRLFFTSNSDIELYLTYLESFLSCKDYNHFDEIDHIEEILDKCHQIKEKRKREDLDFRMALVGLQCLIIKASLNSNSTINSTNNTDSNINTNNNSNNNTDSNINSNSNIQINGNDKFVMNLELFEPCYMEWIVNWSIRHGYIDSQIHIHLLMELLSKTVDINRFAFLLRGLLSIAFLYHKNKLLLDIYYQIETKILPTNIENYPKEELEWLIIAAYNYGITDRIWLLQASRLCTLPEHFNLKEQIESTLDDL